MLIPWVKDYEVSRLGEDATNETTNPCNNETTTSCDKIAEQQANQSDSDRVQRKRKWDEVYSKQGTTTCSSQKIEQQDDHSGRIRRKRKWSQVDAEEDEELDNREIEIISESQSVPSKNEKLSGLKQLRAEIKPPKKKKKTKKTKQSND